MSKTTQTQPAPRAWTRPELARLGKIADVAGNTGSAFQQGNNKS